MLKEEGREKNEERRRRRRRKKKKEKKKEEGEEEEEEELKLTLASLQIYSSSMIFKFICREQKELNVLKIVCIRFETCRVSCMHRVSGLISIV